MGAQAFGKSEIPIPKSEVRIHLEPVRVQNLRGRTAIEGRAAHDWIVQPVLGIDEMDIVAGTQYPSESRLPTHYTTH